MKTTVNGKVQNPVKAAAAMRRKPANKKAARKRPARRSAVADIARTASEIGAAAMSAVTGDNKLGGREEAIRERDPLMPTPYERRAHAGLLGQAAARIQQHENELVPLRQMARMIELVETLMGRNGHRIMRASAGADAEESLVQKLVAASKHQSELAELATANPIFDFGAKRDLKDGRP